MKSIGARSQIPTLGPKSSGNTVVVAVFLLVVLLLQFTEFSGTLYSMQQVIKKDAVPSKSTHEKSVVSTEDWKENIALQRVPVNVLDKINYFMNQNKTERPLPPNTPGVFLHIGKAGGSTVSSVLENSCHSWVPKPCARNKTTIPNKETHVGSLVTYVHTPDFQKMGSFNEKKGKPYYPDYSFHLATVRDPYRKFLSVFTFFHPENHFLDRHKYKRVKGFQECKKLYSCFRTPELFATQLGDNPLDFEYRHPDSKISTENCTNLARATMANKVSACAEHFYWNTKTVLERIPGWNVTSSPTITNIGNHNNNHTDANIESFYWDTASSLSQPPPFFLVIRTEYMNQDFFTANYVLGDPDPVEMKDMGAYKTGRIQIDNFIPLNVTNLARARLCKALLPEYKMYVRALARAINLSDKDRQTSLELSRTNCPNLDWLFQKNFVD